MWDYFVVFTLQQNMGTKLINTLNLKIISKYYIATWLLRVNMKYWDNSIKKREFFYQF